MRPAIGIGIALFLAALLVAAMGLPSIPAPTFEVRVDPSSAFAPRGQGAWQVEVVPASDAERLQARLDRAVDLGPTVKGAGVLSFPLSNLSPGYHFIEGRVYRRGARVDQVVDVVAAGPFQQGRDRGCDVAMALSPEAVRMLLAPAIEHKIVAGAQTQTELFGETSYVASSTIEVVDGGIEFSVELDTTEEGKGDLSVAGIVEVASTRVDGIELRLRELKDAKPGPKLEEIAADVGGKRGTEAGVGGGAVVGGILGGPAGAVIGGLIGGVAGNEIGERIAKHEAGKRTRDEVYDALVDGLRLATRELALPKGIELLPTQPALLANTRWCEPLSLGAELGLRASLAIEITDDRFTKHARSVAVFRETPLSAIDELPEGRNAAVAVSEDFVNRLLAEWTVRDGFDSALMEAGLTRAIEAELGARTRWEARDIEVELPPTVRLEDGEIAAELGGVRLRLVDPQREATRDVVVGGVGSLSLGIRKGVQARIGGRLEQAYFGCRSPDEEGRVLPACFSSAVDPELVRKKINLAIVVNAAQLPSLDLSGLVRLRLASETRSPVDLSEADVSVHPGQLRLDATLVGAP